MRHFENKLQDFNGESVVNVDKEKWKRVCKNKTSEIIHGMPPTLQNCDGGLYVGCTGVAYMFYNFLKNPIFSEKSSEYMSHAADYITASIKYATSKHNRDPGPSFILGPAGVYFMASLVCHQRGDVYNRDSFIAEYAKLATECLKMNYMKDGSDELFVGRAGYLCGLFSLRKVLKCPVVEDSTIKAICDTILQSGRNYSKQKRLKVPLMYAYYGTEYLGSAHGLSSILQMLLRFSQYLDESGLTDVRASVDFMLSVEQSNFNYAPAMDEVTTRRSEEHELVHWCHGAPGVVYMFAQAYKVWDDQRYLQACQRCAELTWQKGLLRKGPGICHGVAGSGYVFLLLYRLTNDLKYLHRANQFAEFLFSPVFQVEAKHPDSPFSLYEGWAGTLCFLSHLTQPEEAEFPFFDVF